MVSLKSSNMFLAFNIQFLFNLLHEKVICVGTWHGAHASGVGACIPRYGTLEPFLIPGEDEVFGLDGPPCLIRFLVVVSGLLNPLLCIEQENWVLWHKVEIVDDDRVYPTFIIFNSIFNCTLYSDINHHTY